MEKKSKATAIAVMVVFLCSTLFFLKVNPADALVSAWIDEKELGEMCIGQVVPMAQNAKTEVSDDSAGQEEQTEEIVQSGTAGEKEEKSEETESTKEESNKKEESEEEEVTVTGDPLVIIYHTHATESYMPYSESNYHRETEEGTVRDVGTVLETELKKKGIGVVHDKTLHDRPSYNDSYNRSLETIEALREKYPSAIYIIDLHRDAAAASAKEGKYLEIDGERVAKFSMVVGEANENYVELYGYAKKISETAESMYEGFGGAIIEQNYKYNEYISNRCLLLEIGNNKNTIEETRRCGKYFANVLAKVIKSEQ